MSKLGFHIPMLFMTAGKTEINKSLNQEIGMKNISILILGIMLLPFIQSCKKNTSLDMNPNVNVSNDVIISISSYTNVFNLLIKARLDPSLAKHGWALIDSANVTYDSLKMEYGFNFYSKKSPDSVLRSGRIAMLVSGDILQKGSYARVFFQSYHEDNGKVDGIDSIANEGVDDFGQLVFSDYISHGSSVKVLGGGTISVELAAKYKTMVSTLVPGNDILFLAEGTISGISSKGYVFSASIHDTLQDSFACPWIKGGIIDVHVPAAEITDGYIDFVANDGCSDVIWYYFDTSDFMVWKNQYYLKN